MRLINDQLLSTTDVILIAKKTWFRVARNGHLVNLGVFGLDCYLSVYLLRLKYIGRM